MKLTRAFEQQFGIWKVLGDHPEDEFIAVAFRGTASITDVIEDLRILNPIPLGTGLMHWLTHRTFRRLRA